jgi:hypothetical protein
LPSSVSNWYSFSTGPGKLTSLLGHPLAEFGVLGLELREFVAGRLPLLARCGLVLGHRAPPSAVRA